MNLRASLLSLGILTTATSFCLPARAEGLSGQLRGRLIADLVEVLEGQYAVERYALFEIILAPALGGAHRSN